MDGLGFRIWFHAVWLYGFKSPLRFHTIRRNFQWPINLLRCLRKLECLVEIHSVTGWKCTFLIWFECDLGPWTCAAEMLTAARMLMPSAPVLSICSEWMRLQWDKHGVIQHKVAYFNDILPTFLNVFPMLVNTCTNVNWQSLFKMCIKHGFVIRESGQKPELLMAGETVGWVGRWSFHSLTFYFCFI